MNIFKFLKRFMVLTVFIAVVLSVSQVFATLTYASNIDAIQLGDQSNIERSLVDLPGLQLDSQLSSAALAKANDMILQNYWAHNSPTGTTPWSFIAGSGYQYTVAGENLAMGFSNSKDVVDGWMASPAHKENVLNSSYTDVGYAVVDGELIGNHTTLVVAMYGTRSSSVVAGATSTEPSQESLINRFSSFMNIDLLVIIVDAWILLVAFIWLMRHIQRNKRAYGLTRHAAK